MNPSMIERIRAGGFARIVIEDDTPFTGYIANDPDPNVPAERLRMDGYILGPSGHLEQISIGLNPEEIRHIQFLPEAPEFIDHEGNSIRMTSGFFPDDLPPIR